MQALYPDNLLNEEPARPAVLASSLVQACDLVVLVHGSHVPETRGKVRVPGGRTFMQNCVKRSQGLTWCSPPQAVAWSTVDGLALLPGNGTQSSPAPEFVPATFGHPPAEFLEVVLAAWHDGARSQDSHFVLQQVEERDRIVKAVHVVLVSDLQVLHKTADNTAD